MTEVIKIDQTELSAYNYTLLSKAAIQFISMGKLLVLERFSTVDEVLFFYSVNLVMQTICWRFQLCQLITF